MSLLVVGTVAFDAIETPFGKTDKILGGAATYISLSASHFTDNIHIVSVVGNDFPNDHLELMKRHNIHLDGLEIVNNGKTFFWSGKYRIDMNTRDTLATELNVLADFKPVVPPSAKNSEILMLGNLTPSIQKSVIEQMDTRPKLIVMDTMNYWMDTALDDLKEVLVMIDILAINDEEARLLSDEYSLVKAANRIMEMGPEFLIIKKGEHGALLFHEKNIYAAPALPLEEVFDPTGAGDTFAGGFTGYLAQTRNYSFENMKRAVIYGSAMASFAVEKFGTERLIGLTKRDIERRVQLFLDLVQVDISIE